MHRLDLSMGLLLQQHTGRESRLALRIHLCLDGVPGLASQAGPSTSSTPVDRFRPSSQVAGWLALLVLVAHRLDPKLYIPLAPSRLSSLPLLSTGPCAFNLNPHPGRCILDGPAFVLYHLLYPFLLYCLIPPDPFHHGLPQVYRGSRRGFVAGFARHRHQL